MAKKNATVKQKYFARVINYNTGYTEKDLDNNGTYFDSVEELVEFIQKNINEDPFYFEEFEFYICAVNMQPYKIVVNTTATLVKGE